MTLEQQIKNAIEAAAAQLSGQLQERMQSVAAVVSQAASVEHARMLDEAVALARARLALEHDAAISALQAEAAGQRDLAVSMARTEAAEQHAAAMAAARALAVEQQAAAVEAQRTDAALQKDAALAALRAELAAGHDAAIAALRAETAGQRQLAVSMARTEAAGQHEAALAAVREEAAKQHEAALAALRAEAAIQKESALAALRTELAAGHDAALAAVQSDAASERESALTALRSELIGKHETALSAALAAAIAAVRVESRSALEAELASVRTEADARLAQVQSEADQRVQQARSESQELLAHARIEADERLVAAQAGAEEALARSVEAAKAEAALASSSAVVDAHVTGRAGETLFGERILDAVRRLDSARSLTEVLDVLVDAGAREVPRVAVFLLRGDKLVGWRAAGFGRDDDPNGVEVALDQAGFLAAAVRSGMPVSSSDEPSAAGGTTLFGTLPLASAGIAVPLRVGGEPVGVLYADDVSARERQSPGVWPESIEVLARHAVRCLEVVTVSRVTQPMIVPPRSNSTPTPRRYTPPGRPFQAGHDDDDDAAKRYARLLVSEIKLYHESAITAGRRDRNLLERLRPEIDRARRLYDERVPPAILARTGYFDQELVRTLANGDASLLGPA